MLHSTRSKSGLRVATVLLGGGDVEEHNSGEVEREQGQTQESAGRRKDAVELQYQDSGKLQLYSVWIASSEARFWLAKV